MYFEPGVYDIYISIIYTITFKKNIHILYLYYIYIDITFTVHMCKVFESIIFLEMIVPSNSHQKSSWLCEAVFCQDRIAKRMVEEAEKTLGSAMGRQNCTGEFPQTMADRGRLAVNLVI